MQPIQKIVVQYFFALIFLSILFHGRAEAGQEIVIVQSIRIPPYEEVIRGFKSISPYSITRVVLSEPDGAEILKKVDEIRPCLVLTIGIDALSKVKSIQNIPIVYLMVLNPQSMLSGEKNITGISMNIPPEDQLRILLDALPETKTVGLVYNPDNTGTLVKKARNAAGRFKIQLTAIETHSPRDVPASIKDMGGKIDVFWMLPDATVFSPETVEYLILFSLENKTPIVTFSEKYVEMGALMSIGLDPFDLGLQAGKRANAILTENASPNVKEIDARKALISINMKIAKKLGVTVDEKIIKKAKVID